MPHRHPPLPDFTQRLAALPALPARSLIINCSTRLVTTLALLGALRHGAPRVLLLDCASGDGSGPWFERLRGAYDFDLLFAPLLPHGRMLDLVFRRLRDDSVLLIDSDLEILDAEVLDRTRQGLADPGCYGAGFLHDDPEPRIGPEPALEKGRYAERMWIPFCWLKTAPIREFLERGQSFMHGREYREFPPSPWLSRWLYQRWRIPGLRRISLAATRPWRRRRFGEASAFIEYDTGARLHAALRAAGWRFHDLGEPYWSRSVRHYHGVTRATLSAGLGNATTPEAIAAEVRQRLRQVHGLHDLDPPALRLP